MFVHKLIANVKCRAIRISPRLFNVDCFVREVHRSINSAGTEHKRIDHQNFNALNANYVFIFRQKKNRNAEK